MDDMESKLTEYVLGELDQQQRAEIERAIEADPDARALVEKIKQSADMVTDYYRSEPMPRLDDHHHRRIMAARRQTRRRFPRWIVPAAAAVIIATVGFGALIVTGTWDKGGEKDEQVLTPPEIWPGAEIGLSKTPVNGLKALDIELPRPLFEGTPKRIQGVNNLEPPKGKNWKREPFYAPPGTVNLARGKEVKASDDLPIIGEPDMITDGDKEGIDQSVVEFAPGRQWVQIDLGARCRIYAIVIWHYHKQARAYKDVIVQVADDEDMITGKKTIFNNDDDNSSKLGIGEDFSYVETNQGKLINAKGIVSRYVRLWSNGNSTNDMNHYIEVQVWGKPAK